MSVLRDAGDAGKGDSAFKGRKGGHQGGNPLLEKIVFFYFSCLLVFVKHNPIVSKI